MPAAHTDGMARSCGAVTVVVNQSTTFVRGRLWAVEGDPNSHGDGGLIPTGSSVFVEGKLVIVNSPDGADPDALCPPLDGAHCFPETAQGSLITFAYGPGGEGPPIEDPHPGVDWLTADDLTVGPPVLGTPELHAVVSLTAVSLTVAAPTLGTPVLRPVTVLTADGLTVAAPVLGTPAIGQVHALSASSLTVAAPTLGTPSLGLPNTARREDGGAAMREDGSTEMRE